MISPSSSPVRGESPARSPSDFRAVSLRIRERGAPRRGSRRRARDHGGLPADRRPRHRRLRDPGRAARDGAARRRVGTVSLLRTPTRGRRRRRSRRVARCLRTARPGRVLARLRERRTRPALDRRVGEPAVPVARSSRSATRASSAAARPTSAPADSATFRLRRPGLRAPASARRALHDPAGDDDDLAPPLRRARGVFARSCSTGGCRPGTSPGSPRTLERWYNGK